MFSWFFNCIYSVIHYLWDNIINRSVYGVKIWQICFLVMLLSLFMRVVVMPTLGGYTYSPNVPTNKANMSAFHKYGNSSDKKADTGIQSPKRYKGGAQW